MSLPRCVLYLSFLATLMATAHEKSRTDVWRDDLAGPVKSVSSTVVRTSVQWQQPGGPTLRIPIWCADCDYDRDGFRTKSGQRVDGKFVGQVIRIVRDSNGQATRRLIFDASTGQLDGDEVTGPFGTIEGTSYVAGELDWRQTYSYDQYGHLTDRRTFDRKGEEIEKVLTNTDANGVLENSGWEHGQLSYQQTFDPETTVEPFTTFDSFGRVKLTWTVVAGELVTF